MQAPESGASNDSAISSPRNETRQAATYHETILASDLTQLSISRPETLAGHASVQVIAETLQGVPYTARAQYSFRAENGDEHSLTEGDMLEVTESGDDGWSCGYRLLDGRRQGGQKWFPTTYVEKTSMASGQISATQSRQPIPPVATAPLPRNAHVDDDADSSDSELEVDRLNFLKKNAHASSKAGDHSKCEEFISAILKSLPITDRTFPVWTYNLAHCQYLQKKYTECLATAQTVRTDQSTKELLGMAKQVIADASFQLGDLGTAEAACKKAISIWRKMQNGNALHYSLSLMVDILAKTENSVDRQFYLSLLAEEEKLGRRTGTDQRPAMAMTQPAKPRTVPKEPPIDIVRPIPNDRDRSSLDVHLIPEDRDIRLLASYGLTWDSKNKRVIGFAVDRSKAIEAALSDIDFGLQLFKFSDLLHFRRPNGDQPLDRAVLRGDENMTRLLIDYGADVRAANPTTDYTPLHLASMGDSQAIVKLLILHDADVNAICKYGETPLHLAGRLRPDYIDILMDAGADIKVRNKRGETPHRWTWNGEVPITSRGKPVML